MSAGTSAAYVAVRKVSVEIEVSISCSTRMSVTAPAGRPPERRSQSESVAAVSEELRKRGARCEGSLQRGCPTDRA